MRDGGASLIVPKIGSQTEITSRTIPGSHLAAFRSFCRVAHFLIELTAMTASLAKAFAKAFRLPEAAQEQLAAQVLKDVRGELRTG